MTDIETSVKVQDIAAMLNCLYDELFHLFYEERNLPESLSERLAADAVKTARRQLCAAYGITVDQYYESQYGIH